jgi:hypothetical protein
MTTAGPPIHPALHSPDVDHGDGRHRDGFHASHPKVVGMLGGEVHDIEHWCCNVVQSAIP